MPRWLPRYSPPSQQTALIGTIDAKDRTDLRLMTGDRVRSAERFPPKYTPREDHELKRSTARVLLPEVRYEVLCSHRWSILQTYGTSTSSSDSVQCTVRHDRGWKIPNESDAMEEPDTRTTISDTPTVISPPSDRGRTEWEQ